MMTFLTPTIYFVVLIILFLVIFSLMCYLPKHYDWADWMKIDEFWAFFGMATIALLIAAVWIFLIYILPVIVLYLIAYFIYKYLK